MDKESKRDNKRQSAKKQREFSVYSQKAVRAKEALLEKQKTTSCPAQGVQK
jgi:hypothetical protein